MGKRERLGVVNEDSGQQQIKTNFRDIITTQAVSPERPEQNVAKSLNRFVINFGTTNNACVPCATYDVSGVSRGVLEGPQPPSCS